jgi:hypothetical protein
MKGRIDVGNNGRRIDGGSDKGGIKGPHNRSEESMQLNSNIPTNSLERTSEESMQLNSNIPTNSLERTRMRRTHCTAACLPCLDAIYSANRYEEWTPERNAIGHARARASSEHAWGPMASSSVNYCRKTCTAAYLIIVPIRELRHAGTTQSVGAVPLPQECSECTGGTGKARPRQQNGGRRKQCTPVLTPTNLTYNYSKV